jgi:GNAT superfamily N-acetyltransferase
MNWAILQLDKHTYGKHLTLAVFAYLISNQRNTWIEIEPYGKIYIRRSVRAVSMGELFSALDISAIEFKPKYRSKGFFKLTLKIFEKMARQHNLQSLYVECIHEPRLHAYLLRQGFKEMPIDRSSVYRRIIT